MQGFVRSGRLAILILGLAGITAKVAAQGKPDQPVDLTASGDVEPVTGENEHALSITGFGVGGYTYDGKTNDNSFAAGKVAVSLFRELTDNLYVFGQLTTSISDEAGGEPVTETEIDNLPSTSFNFELARPAKLTGLFAGWTLSRKLDLTALVANGWDTPLDPNHGKTVGARLGILPAERSSIGLSALYGSEGPADTTNHRLLLNADYAFEPGRGWIVAGEANYGKDYDLPGGGDARWSGAMLLVHRQVTRNWGIAARAEVMDDKDGARTGLAQTLTSYTIAPIYSIGVGREGIFADIQHTTHRIPRFQVRGEIRLNHSNVPLFETSDGILSNWGVQYTLQLVSTF